MSLDIYREHIIDLYKNPRNFGILERATHEKRKVNALCGDEIVVRLVVSEDKIEDVKFEGKGCAISIASSSLLSDKLKGMSVSEALGLSEKDILEMMKIPISPVRMKCALLSLEAIKEALA